MGGARHSPPGVVRLIGIGGPSAAGKSSTAERLAKALLARIIRLDGFNSYRTNCPDHYNYVPPPRFESHVLGRKNREGPHGFPWHHKKHPFPTDVYGFL